MPTEYKKSRRPYDLSYDDYDNFLLGLPLFEADHSGDADFYPNYALIPPLMEDYHVKFSSYVDAQNHEDDARDDYIDDSVTPLRDALIGLRRLLPALFDDDSMLVDFGINVDIETDVDKLIVQAEICRDHWAELCDPAVPPEYLPVQGKLDAIGGLITALTDAREAYAEATRDREIAQNALADSREAINHEERRMFNWYRGLYTNAEDEWWTETPWGKASGGGESGEQEEPDEFTCSVREVVPGEVEFKCNLMAGIVRVRLDIRSLPDGLWQVVIEEFTILDGELIPHRESIDEPGEYEAMFTPIDEMGEPWGEPVIVPFTVTE